MPPTDDLADIHDRRRRKRLTSRDPMGRETGTLEEEDTMTVDALAMHRPGFRYLADRSASEAAYVEYCRELQDAWKPKPVSTADVGIKPLPFGAQPTWAQVEGSSCSIDGAKGTWTREALKTAQRRF
jgi:hypothetical protein